MKQMWMVWKKYLKASTFSSLVVVLFFLYALFAMYEPSGDNVISTAPIRLPDDRLPLTIQLNMGRLGNQMFLFATLYGICELNDRRMQLIPFNWETLAVYFDIQPDLVDLDTFRPAHPWTIGNWLEEKDKHIPYETDILSGNPYPTSFTFFHHVRDQIRTIFTFREPLQHFAQSSLRRVLKVKPKTKVFVAIHVRRGDYVHPGPGGWLWDYEGREVDLEYFEKAIDYFHNKYGGETVAFLAVSEDRGWCRKHLSHFGVLTIPDSPSPAHDLALMAACNHTIMTYGTFGFWGGYLSGGDVVYFADFLKPNTTITRTYFRYEKMYPEEWFGISTTKEGYWENYTNPFT